MAESNGTEELPDYPIDIALARLTQAEACVGVIESTLTDRKMGKDDGLTDIVLRDLASTVETLVIQAKDAVSSMIGSGGARHG